MADLLVVYDNSVRPGEIIRDIIGQKGYGDVVVKRRHLQEYYRDSLEAIFPAAKWTVVNNLYDLDELRQRLATEGGEASTPVLHCFADFMLNDVDLVGLTLRKLPYLDEPVQLLCEKRCLGLMFDRGQAYLEYLERALARHDSQGAGQCRASMNIEGAVYIGEIRNFIQALTGNFDSRYFNSLQGTEYVLRKASRDKEKIRSEYQYYQLLPEKMRRWFVMPFDYRETETEASYAMERLYMTDLAVKWVHGSVGMEEFKQILSMYFTFFRERPSKAVTQEEYQACRDGLYVVKVRRRLARLGSLPQFASIATLLQANKRLLSLEDIFKRYLDLKKKVEQRLSYPCVSVIGHGDPCFANAMYNYATRTLKFIDPRGALSEAELYTDPYYDIAKLSHSVCGCYDFFNNGMYDISIAEDFDYSLKIDCHNQEYKEAFRQQAEAAGFDYWTVRLYEASLFLSMLPLHIDYPHKVLGFLLNAVDIMKEIEENV